MFAQSLPLEDKRERIAKASIILVRDETGLVRVFGMPAVRRLILLAQQLGLESIYLVGHVNALRTAVSDLLSSEAFHSLEAPAMLDQTVQGLDLPEGGKVLVWKANHVVDRSSLSRLMAAGDRPGFFCLGAEGKSDCEGIYLVSTTDLVPLLRALWPADSSEGKILREAQRINGVSGLPDVIGKGQDQRKILEGKLIASLSFQTEMDDGFLARHLDRRVSRFLSKRLAHTKLTPNQITLAGVIIGLTGAFFLSLPGYWKHLFGSLLFLLCVVIDGVDGEVARLRLQETSFGHYLDVMTDNIVHVAIFVGMALGLYHGTGDGRYIQALWFLLGGFGLCAVTVYFCILRLSPEVLKQSPKIMKLMALLTNRDFAYLIVVLALIHRLQWFLFGAAAGTYLFAAILWTLSLYQKRAISR